MTDHEHPDDQIEWPREIWMGEREEHDQGVVTAVLSESATVARWEGDKERDREFHRYVDADIHESAERYYKARIAAAEAAAYRKAADAVRRRVETAKEKMNEARLLGSGAREWAMISAHLEQTHEAIIRLRDDDDECSDCPHGGYPTDTTRCAECPRAAAILALADTSALDEALAAEREKCAQMRPDLYAIYGADRTDSFAKGFCSGVEAYAAAIRKGDQA
jgi:hypothetical protein